MALTALQIFKYLPGGLKQENANCKKCSCPTCMAFAMKLVKNQVSPDTCPYISEEAKALLSESFKKPQKEIQLGTTNPLKIGGENVLFRHEKKFINQTTIAIRVSSSENYKEKLQKIKNYSIERVGETFGISAINIVEDDPQKFEALIAEAEFLDFPIIATTTTEDGTKKVIEKLKHKKFLLDNEKNKDKDQPFVINGSSTSDFEKKTEQLLKEGIENIVLNIDESNILKAASLLTEIRYESIQNKKETLGFPTMIKLSESSDKFALSILSSVFLCKYANIIVLPDISPEVLSSLLTLRQSIFIDPQVPLQVKPGLYEIADPKEDSLVFVTTNFALTYFAMRNELESLNLPSYLLITDADGMSVLTAWSASKLTGETIAKAVNTSELEKKINHKNIIIPGFVDVLKEETEEELPGWKVIVGCNEASDLRKVLPSLQQQVK